MYEVFYKLISERGITAYQVSKDTGIGQSTISAWKKSGNILKKELLKTLSEYFGVSVEYLITGKDTEKESTSGKKYYFSDETAEMAQELFENPAQKILFDASRNSKPENLLLAAEMLNRFKGTNNG